MPPMLVAGMLRVFAILENDPGKASMESLLLRPKNHQCFQLVF